MREEPSLELTELVAELGLATPAQLRAAARQARALARDLPLFDSVWVDALVQLRLVTPFQAREIQAGRGRQLRIGDCVLGEPLASLGYATRYLARSLAGRQALWLDVVEHSQISSDEAADRLATHVAQCRRASVDLIDAGVDAGRIWFAASAASGVSAGEWTVRNGRFPPQVVLEIARQMAAELARLESHGILHGDLSAATVVLAAAGEVQTPLPGLRAIVRPEEGHTHAELAPEAYDYLAPERIAHGTPATRASDLYACGCVWHHLLTGRPPLAGGDSLSKLKAAQAAKIVDVRRLAPETPAPLAAATAQCTQPDPARRPANFVQLSAMLGPSTREGRAALAECLLRRRPRTSALVTATELMRRSRHTPVWLSAAAGCLLMVATLSWPWWRPAISAPLASIWSSAPAAKESPPPPVDPAAPAASPVLPSAAVEPSAAQHEVGAAEELASQQDIFLPSDRLIRAEELRFVAGQLIRASAEGRARVLIANQGLRIAVEGVRFENIDFIAAPPPTAAPGAIVNLAAASAEFRNCSFQTHPAAAAWTAIEWNAPTDRGAGAAALHLADCMLQRVRVGVDCRGRGAALVELHNTLHLGPGPLSRIYQAPAVDQPVALSLHGCTLRGAAALLDVAYRELDDALGKISIEAVGCVFADGPREHSATIRLAGAAAPDRLLRAIDWQGQGSLLAATAPFIAWYAAPGQRQVFDDSQVAIDGLVRGEFTFRGAPSGYPADSEILRWAAPLRSDEPPGIRPAPLHLPDLTRE